MRFSLLLVLLSVYSYSQHDSVRSAILSIQNDTEKVNQLYAYGFSIRNSDPQVSFSFATDAQSNAQKSGSYKHLAKAYNLLGILFYKKGNYKTALQYHNKALALRTKIADILGIAYSNTNLGNVYSDLKLYAKAERSYLTALNAYQDLGNTMKISECLVNLGTLKHYMKQYDAAIESYELALKTIPESNYDSRAMCLSNLAEAYLAKGEVEKALALSEDALKLRTMCDNRIEAGESYANIGGIQIILKDFEQAKKNLDTADAIAEYYDYSDLKLSVWKKLSYYNAELKNFEEAFKWLKRSNDLHDSLLAEAEMSKLKYDFDEREFEQTNETRKNNFRNTWFLILMMVLAIGIPFTVIRHKR